MSAPAAAMLLASAASATITNTDHTFSTSSLSTYTFTARSLGAAAGGRKIIVGVGELSAGSISISSLTVAGNAATEVVNTGAGTEASALYIIDDASNSTADIVVTLSGAAARLGISVFAATGLNSSTATDTGSSAANPMTDTLNISAGGIAVAHAAANSLSAVPTFSWSGLTESFDETIDTPNKTGHSGACLAFAAAQTGLTITATPSSFYSGRLVMASFR